MIAIVESCALDAEPEVVWHWLEQLDGNYGALHPEHLTWRTLRGKPLETGSVWFADEWIGGRRVQGRFQVIESSRGRHFSYRALGLARLIGVQGSFRLAQGGPGRTELSQEVRFGFRTGFADWLIGRVAGAGEIRRHMREEQEQMRSIFGQLP